MSFTSSASCFSPWYVEKTTASASAALEDLDLAIDELTAASTVVEGEFRCGLRLQRSGWALRIVGSMTVLAIALRWTM
ncbi:hypothetical protein GQ600_12882 [Phytophthora cactorum]|nr:hypothetical protein GQ600_12882 [Phytophthora cactorum]